MSQKIIPNDQIKGYFAFSVFEGELVARPWGRQSQEMEGQDDTRTLSMAASVTWEKCVSLMLEVIWNHLELQEDKSWAIWPHVFNRLLHSTREVEELERWFSS